MDRTGLQTALKNRNVIAFLRAIRPGEGTSDPAGYYRIVGGGLFTDVTKHPNRRVFLERYGVYSTAAGAYQIIYRTYLGLQKQYGFTMFDRGTQDEMAVALIVEKRALQDVINGNFFEAVRKCSSIWASLPGSLAGQRTESIDKIREVYLASGGVVSAIT
jgi:muramidase (phage lysozyme)